MAILRRLTIVSGGQSGVDRAALDAAIALGLDYGGWCPRGGWAEDFPDPPGILEAYTRLRETPLADPAQRTEWNVRDADATLILVDAGGLAISRGSALAYGLAAKYAKPTLVVDLGAPDADERALDYLRLRLAARVPGFALGIGGPRESEAPGIYRQAHAFLGRLFVAFPANVPARPI